jgi:hypothetical protein
MYMEKGGITYQMAMKRYGNDLTSDVLGLPRLTNPGKLSGIRQPSTTPPSAGRWLCNEPFR